MFHCDEVDAVDAHLIAECTLLMEEVGIIRLFSYADCESEVTQSKMCCCASCACVGGWGWEKRVQSSGNSSSVTIHILGGDTEGCTGCHLVGNGWAGGPWGKILCEAFVFILCF